MSDRCYACCQENCGYRRCDCDCHDRKLIPVDDIKNHQEPVILGQTGGELDRTFVRGLIGNLLSPMKCRRHPRYQGKRKPRAACEECFYIWEAGGFKK